MKVGYFIGLLLMLGFIGCASTANTAEHADIYLGEKPDFEKLKSFQKLVKTTPGSLEYEKARIDYLLERLSLSSYNFIRNDEVHSSLRGVVHLKWKYLRFRKDAPTAEAFIENVASGSRVSGEDYMMEISPGKKSPLRDVFYNELKLLDQGFLEHQERIKKAFEESKKLREESATAVKISEKNNAEDFEPSADVLR